MFASQNSETYPKLRIITYIELNVSLGFEKSRASCFLSM